MFNIKQSFRTGLGFGLTSGIITTLGLMVGLHSGTNSKVVVLGGILFIAIADALSDALGIHVSEESKKTHVPKETWEITASTFLSKFVIALTFIIPILLIPLFWAVIVSILWGLLLISLFSFYVAKQQNAKPYKVILEHLIIAIFVIIITHYLGNWVATLG